LKQWVQKLIDQLDRSAPKSKVKISDERATLLYLIDVYNKNLIDMETRPVRSIRDELDGFAKELVTGKVDVEDTLFRFRKFFSSYRVAEYSYVSKSFEDFKNIIWSFVEQLSEDFRSEQSEDQDIKHNLQQLKEAVETDSIGLLRDRSKQFISFYVEHQSKQEARRSKRIKGIKKNLDVVKKQLVEADRSSRLDHLTQAFNRRSFDEQVRQQYNLFHLSQSPVSMLVIDIDFFKKVNDTYGHDIGDFVLKECVRVLHETFKREGDFVARIGGEEFAVILPSHSIDQAIKRADEIMARIRRDVFIINNTELRFTISMGIAQLDDKETFEQWIKRADAALYDSKHGGRNR
jgi:diguanylate cyclase